MTRRGPRVFLDLGDNFQRAVRGNPPGTRFVIASGVHRLQRVRPKNDMVFTGEPGAVMSGARVLTSFSREGSMWVAEGQTQQGAVHPGGWPDGIVLPGYERDNYPEEVFIDGVRLRHVSSTSDVVPGTWFFDYAGDKIYLGDEPSGKLIETSVTDFAFVGSATGVVIDDLTVHHYANPTQSGAIQAKGGKNWTIERVDASYNHSWGISLGPGLSLRRSKMTYNGQLGLGGGGGTADAPIVIEDNEIAYNLDLGFNWEWEGGALKITNSTGTVFRNNWVHHNNGPGIWFDIYNRQATIEGNLVERNEYIGIFYEISYGPTTINLNTVRNNGSGQPGADGAGIRISNSRNIEVYDNVVDSNERGIMLTMVDREKGPDGRLETTDVMVRGNDIRMLTGTTGLVEETGNLTYYTSKGNVFANNVYYVEDDDETHFSWFGPWHQERTWDEWQAFGNDVAGELQSADAFAATGGFVGVPYGPTER